MALLPRLRHRLAREARRLAGALRRLADGVEPEPRGSGDPPAHWLAVVRARAPQLLEGRGIGVRVEEVVEPEPDVVADAPAPGWSHGARPPDWPGLRPEEAGQGDWPEAADAATSRARWPQVGRVGDEPASWPRIPDTEFARAAWPALPDADRAGAEWPEIEPAAAIEPTWPTRRSAPPAPPDWVPPGRGEPPDPAWPAVRGSVGRPSKGHERARPALRWTGSWPAPAGPPPGATGRWPAASPPRRRTVETGVVDDRKRPTTTPSSVRWAGSGPASDVSFDAGTRGRWPSLPDDEEQRRPPVALDTVDAERIHRLDLEQRGR